MKRLAILAAALIGFAAPAWAAFETGWYAYTAGDFVMARSEWLPLARDGDARAQFQLGVMYQKGEGVAADATEAARWYGLAAEQDHAPSQASLAGLYYTGQGVAHDHHEAVGWFERAARQGNTDAQYRLGALYLRGHGVPKDVVRAHAWLSLAAMRGSKSARERRVEVEAMMSAAELAEAEKLRQEMMGSN